MKAVVQRVSSASVQIGGRLHSAIGKGMVVLLGVESGDTDADADLLAAKIAGMRFFADAAGKMNLAAGDVGGAALVVSQFTLCADCRKGRRPSFINAAQPAEAERLYERFAANMREAGIRVETGVFQAEMLVHIDNDGPVTFVIDTKTLK
ncbi:MAG TPA: D-aminoacyl-tRNA deacylase [Planctomycetota bacterium]|nr:D-aminoacyl-tRNA deacylase [Planctomycetota bacterium]